MSLRSGFRKLRMFYKSYGLFNQTLKQPWKALLLPIVGSGRFAAKNGMSFDMPPGKWELLPTMCRLTDMGAIPSFEPGRKKVLLGDLCLYSPEDIKEEGVFYREVFVDDVYRLRNQSLDGKVAVDIGSFIGDAAIAMARRGATVYAFEPSVRCNRFLESNISANNLVGKILPMHAGLSNTTRKETLDGDELVFVEAIDFVLQKLPGEIGMLKMDCEGCEYHLLGDRRFLDHLQPEMISMEYHHGGEEVESLLAAAGYSVDWANKTYPVGMMYATRIVGSTEHHGSN